MSCDDLFIGLPCGSDDECDDELNHIGGQPSWLSGRHILSAAQAYCTLCETSMLFIAQIFCPLEHLERCFHRIVHLYHCAECQRVKAFRMQAREPAALSNVELAKLCICGLKGDKQCGQCKQKFYCGAAHQKLDWPHVERNERFILPKTFFVAEREASERERAEFLQERNASEMQRIKAKRRQAEQEDLPVDELEAAAEDAERKHDELWDQFQVRIATDRDQILRYWYWHGFGDGVALGDEKALWLTSHAPIKLGADVPPCGNCGAPRRFEFQLMPQALHYLSCDVQKNSTIEFGALYVFTCVDSCDKTKQTDDGDDDDDDDDDDNGAVEEFVFRHDLRTQVL